MATSCDLNAPRCTTVVLRVRLHGSRGGVFVGHRPPRDPGDPPLIYNYINRSFTSIQTVHTHTHKPLCGREYRSQGLWTCNFAAAVAPRLLIGTFFAGTAVGAAFDLTNQRCGAVVSVSRQPGTIS